MRYLSSCQSWALLKLFKEKKKDHASFSNTFQVAMASWAITPISLMQSLQIHTQQKNVQGPQFSLRQWYIYQSKNLVHLNSQKLFYSEWIRSILSNKWTKINLVWFAFKKKRHELYTIQKKVQKWVWLSFFWGGIHQKLSELWEEKQIKAALPHKIRARFSSNY